MNHDIGLYMPSNQEGYFPLPQGNDEIVAGYYFAKNNLFDSVVASQVGLPWPSESRHNAEALDNWLALLKGQVDDRLWGAKDISELLGRTREVVSILVSEAYDLYSTTIIRQSEKSFFRRVFEKVRSSRVERLATKSAIPVSAGVANLATGGVVSHAVATSGLTLLTLWGGSAIGKQVFGGAMKSATRTTLGRTLDNFCEKVSDENIKRIKEIKHEFKEIHGRRMTRSERASAVRDLEVRQECYKLMRVLYSEAGETLASNSGDNSKVDITDIFGLSDALVRGMRLRVGHVLGAKPAPSKHNPSS